LRLLTYNIRYGGAGRLGPLVSVINECGPDVVVLQEATLPEVVERLAAATGMKTWAAQASHSVGFMSRIDIAHHAWHRPGASRRAFLEIVPAGMSFRIFGLHLSAVHSNWTERRRVRELRAVLESIAEHQHGFHVLAGDFNTLAPGETLELHKLPARLRAVVWLTGGQIRWETIQIMLDASYVDGYRARHPGDPGFTFPTWDPHVRLDYVFVPSGSAARLKACEVVPNSPLVASASDHLPLLADLDLTPSSS
jgi:exodeoxyribonuclease-3